MLLSAQAGGSNTDVRQLEREGAGDRGTSEADGVTAWNVNEDHKHTRDQMGGRT